MPNQSLQTQFTYHGHDKATHKLIAAWIEAIAGVNKPLRPRRPAQLSLHSPAKKNADAELNTSPWPIRRERTDYLTVLASGRDRHGHPAFLLGMNFPEGETFYDMHSNKEQQISTICSFLEAHGASFLPIRQGEPEDVQNHPKVRGIARLSLHMRDDITLDQFVREHVLPEVTTWSNKAHRENLVDVLASMPYGGEDGFELAMLETPDGALRDRQFAIDVIRKRAEYGMAKSALTEPPDLMTMKNPLYNQQLALRLNNAMMLAHYADFSGRVNQESMDIEAFITKHGLNMQQNRLPASFGRDW